MYGFGTLVPPPPPPPRQQFFFRFGKIFRLGFFVKNSLTGELKTVGFVLKKLIVPNALHYADGYFFAFYLL